jgi:hypothetical protein
MNEAQNPGNTTTFSPPLGQQVQEALEGIRYGYVEIVVHDSKVVQIERHERIRLNPPAQFNNRFGQERS